MTRKSETEELESNWNLHVSAPYYGPRAKAKAEAKAKGRKTTGGFNSKHLDNVGLLPPDLNDLDASNKPASNLDTSISSWLATIFLERGCPYKDCTIKFERIDAFVSHIDARHTTASGKVDCFHSRCVRVGNRGISQLNTFKRHVGKAHQTHKYDMPRKIPIETCKVVRTYGTRPLTDEPNVVTRQEMIPEQGFSENCACLVCNTQAKSFFASETNIPEDTKRIQAQQGLGKHTEQPSDSADIDLPLPSTNLQEYVDISATRFESLKTDGDVLGELSDLYQQHMQLRSYYARCTDDMPLPPYVLQIQGLREQNIPDSVKTWGQLKNWLFTHRASQEICREVLGLQYINRSLKEGIPKLGWWRSIPLYQREQNTQKISLLLHQVWGRDIDAALFEARVFESTAFNQSYDEQLYNQRVENELRSIRLADQQPVPFSTMDQLTLDDLDTVMDTTQTSTNDHYPDIDQNPQDVYREVQEFEALPELTDSVEPDHKILFGDAVTNYDEELASNLDQSFQQTVTTTLVSIPGYTDSGYASLTHKSEKSTSSPKVNAVTEQDDDATIYSEASSIETVTKTSYIQRMAWLLWEDVHALQVDGLLFKDVSIALCDLLAQFALRFGSYTPDTTRNRIMIFVHKHRRDIASTFEKLEQQMENDEDQGPITDHQPVMSMDEKMLLWMAGAEKPDLSADTIEELEDHQEEDEDLVIYLESLVVNDPSYKWLRRRIRRTALCTSSDARLDISNTIITSIGQGRKVGSKLQSASKIALHLDWDLQAFVREQTLAVDKNSKEFLCLDTLENAITITSSSSSSSKCQALTCGEYLELIWPELGQEVLRATRAIVLDENVHPILKDGTKISAEINGSNMRIHLEGTVYAIAEVVEILSWLSAALRTSTEDISACYPVVSEIPLEKKPSFKISYSTRKLRPQLNGQCWHKMFRSSMVVLGYPIRRRMVAMPGLEISIPIITKLLCSNRMNVFNGKLMLKGFSALLVPTDQSESFVHWHYLYEEKGDYLDFSAADSFDGAGVNERDLQKRHIVGWCSHAKVLAGAPGSHYSIQRSHLPKSNASIALKSFALSAGTQPGAMLEASIAVGIKDRPIHVSPAGLGIVDKLRWISQKYVVLYDNQEKRGWLVNGVNALLHLLRASLESYYTDKFNSALKLKPSHIIEPTSEYPDAAIDFFLQDEHKNLQLELYTKRFEAFTESTRSSTLPKSSKLKTTSVLVQDRVEDLFDILAHAITQQVDMARREGIYYKPHFKKFLDGWDFKNIATDHSPFEPVFASLDCFQQPWVNMTRSLNIPILFGRGFGEIIQPASTDKICSRWNTLPTGKTYLAATVATMKEIMERHGDDSSKPMKICDNMLWFHPSSSYHSCYCHDRKDNKHIDKVQVLWPPGLKSKLLHNKATDLPVNGAVVFGHNTSFSWFRNDLGIAIEGIFNPHRTKSWDALDEAVEENEYASDFLSPDRAYGHRLSTSTASTTSDSESTNILSSSPMSRQSTVQTDQSLTKQSSASNSSLQSSPSIRIKRKASLSWLKSGEKREVPEDYSP